MTDFYVPRVKILKPKQEKKESSAAAKKSNNKKSLKKRKREYSNSSIVESSKESSVERRPNRKYCILHSKCMDSRKDLHAMVNKHKEKKKRNITTYGKNNKELNALIETNSKKLSRTRIGERQKKSSNISWKYRFLTTRTKIVPPAW